MVEIPRSRLEALAEIRLSHGSHKTFDYGACAMEMVAYLAGEPHSDHPQCASPVISQFLRTWNDGLNDDDRDRLLKPLLPRLVGTRGSFEDEEARSFLAFDWLARVQVPDWMDLTESLRVHAAALRTLPPINSDESVGGATGTINAARNAARDAARDASRYASRAAAMAAARDAAMDASMAAAWDAARDAAMDAAWAAGMAAAMAAASAAARSCLASVVDTLQASAVDLVERMIEVGVSSEAEGGE